MLRQLLYTAALMVLCVTSGYAQGGGSLQGKVTDKTSGETLPFVNLVVERNGTQVTGGSTDFDGNYSIKPLDAGSYTVKVSFVGYNPQVIDGVIVNNNKIQFLDIKMSSGVDLDVVEIVKYRVPLVDRDGGASGGTVTREEISKMPGRSATSIATTVAGVATDANGGVSIRGARTDGDFYYIDGIKVRGSSNLPKSAIQEVSVLTGGIPANYGDATGGVISITTRGPSSYYFGGIEALSSGFINSNDEAIGLDKFARSTVEGYLSGPLISKKNEKGEKTDPILGFFLSGNYSFTGDASRSIIGRNYLKDDVRESLLADPLRKGSGNGVDYNSSFVTADDFDNVPTSKNARLKQLSLQGKLDVTTSPSINLTFGGSLNYATRTFGGNEFFNSAFNSAENEDRSDLDYRIFGKFTQRFLNSDDKEAKSTVSNAYYTIQLDYSKSLTKVQNSRHKDDFFKYGYIGKYDILKGPIPFELVRDENGVEYLRQSALAGDTGVVFTPGGENPDLEAYTNAYYNLFDDKAGNYDQLSSFVNRGLRNGDSPSRVYGLWSNVGAPYGSYQKFDQGQFRIQASGSADVGKHAVTIGVQFEQRTDRGYSLTNLVGDDQLRNNNIWAIMRNLTNSHINELDRDDSTIVSGDGQYDKVYFATKKDLSAQSTFDRNLRTSLGLDPDGTDEINVDALDPSQLNIDYFSADELIGNGNASRLVTYYGYDVYGNVFNGKASVDDFFNATDENGKNTRPIGAFEPIYASGYIMDKFAFDDIIFNVGLRVDMFDANQQVLKDKYLFKDAFTVADKINGGKILNSDVPTNVGDDFYVYVDNVENPTSVLGYRSGKQFYSKTGQPVDYTSVLSSGGTIAPYLKNPGNSQNGTEPGAYTDYAPQYNFMPRIAFSFPISDEANFTAHYDVLTRRPVSNSRLDIITYNYVNQLGNAVLSNPNLTPEKTIDYELGFQQVLTNSSSLKISAFYKENRDQIQVFTNVGAYPRDYRSVDNLDFGTVKGITLGYDLRRTNNISVKANYTLQFADGTGSAVGGTVNLLNTPFPTLRSIAPLNIDNRHRINAVIDYRYGLGDNYTGPEGMKKILQGMGTNLVLNLSSGSPYSASSDPLNGRLEGTINGSRQPWTFTADFVIDKDFQVTVGKNKEDKPKKLNFNAYVLINNLFNTFNINGVYRFTGDPEDDGYLTDARYQNQVQTQINEQSYRDLYTLSRQQGGNYFAPRTIQLGVKVDF